MKNYRKTPCDQKKPPKNSLKKTVELFRIGETFTLMLFGFLSTLVVVLFIEHWQLTCR